MRIAIHIILVAISLVMLGHAPRNINAPFMLQCFAVAFVSIILYFRLKKKRKRRMIISHSLLFTIAYCVVFYQFDIDYLLGLVDMTFRTNVLTIFNESVVCKALCIANIALNSFFFGLSINENKIYKTNAVYSFGNYQKSLTGLSFLLLLVYLIVVDKQYLFNGYAKGYDAGYPAQLTMSLLQATLIAFVVIKCYICRKEDKEICATSDFWREFKFQIIICILTALLILMSGRRTEAVSVLFSLFFGFVYVYRGKIPVIRIAVVVAFLSFIFSFLSFYRTINGGDANEAVEAVSNISSVFPPTRELAFNASSLHIVLSYVPSQVDYNYGTSFFPGFLTIVPGLHKIFLNLADLPLVKQNSAFFCTIYGNGNLSWGLGTSCVADVYLSFGIIGVIIIFILWGRYLGFLEKISIADLANPFLLALALCTYKELIYITRGSLTYCFGAYTYSALLIYFFSKKTKQSI